MAEGGQHDVTVTLSELERRLLELERELQVVTGPPEAAPAATAPAPPETPAPPDPPAAPDPPAIPVEALLAFREALVATTNELLAAYDRLIEHLPDPPRP